MMVALAGAHRTGKTTLAREYAAKHGARFMETPVSLIFKELGYDPAQKFDFPTRLMIQEEILKRLDAMYRDVDPRVLTITDRSPLDMLAYTLGECSGAAVGDSEQSRLRSYIDRCFEVCNMRFSTVVVVQPGIELVEQEGKAVANPAYIEQLNTLILGLTVGGRLKVAHYYVPRRVTSLADRIKTLDYAIGKTRFDAQQAMLCDREVVIQ
jgi:predicted ATPase